MECSWQYQNNERAIHSIMMSNKGDDLRSCVYVDGAAFLFLRLSRWPVNIRTLVDPVVNDTTYKFGQQNPATESLCGRYP
ncbi:hypothetical protein ACLK1S_08515 [Escherichia coli]